MECPACGWIGSRSKCVTLTLHESLGLSDAPCCPECYHEAWPTQKNGIDGHGTG